MNDDNFGLGIWIPHCCSFKGGFAGKPGKGGPHDDPTGYIAPQPQEIIDWNIDHSYRYDLIVGDLQRIRKYVTTMPAGPVRRHTLLRRIGKAGSTSMRRIRAGRSRVN